MFSVKCSQTEMVFLFNCCCAEKENEAIEKLRTKDFDILAKDFLRSEEMRLRLEAELKAVREENEKLKEELRILKNNSK